MTQAFVRLPGQGRNIDLGNFHMTVHAEGADTGEGLAVLEAAEPAGFGPPMHVHRDAAEAFYVLEGEYVMFVEGDEFRCRAGSFVYVPAGIVHGFRVGAAAGRKLNLYVPHAMIGYFDELSDAIRSGNMSDSQLGEIALRYGMEVIGPVPEGYA